MRLIDFYALVKSKVSITEHIIDKTRLLLTIVLLIIVSIFSTKYYFEQNNLLCTQNNEWEKTQEELHAKLNESENQKNILLQEINNIKTSAVTVASTTKSDSSNDESIQKININTATTDELDKLPGIGPVYAERIVEYRNINNNFKSLEEIKNIKGIGEKTFEKFKDLISI